MATTDPIAQYAAQTQAALAAAQQKKSANSLGIDEFLTLMTAQLKNQDPMKPLEGTEFVAQLAQFGAVSGIQSMQGSIEGLAHSLRATQVLNGSTLIGRDIMVQADAFSFTQGIPVSGEIEAPEGLSSLHIRITDATGTLVREIDIEPRAGINTFTWDGLTDDGTLAESGDYAIEAIGTLGSETGSLEVLMAGRVSSVTLDSTGTNLTLNTSALGGIAMNHVRRVM